MRVGKYVVISLSFFFLIVESYLKKLLERFAKVLIVEPVLKIQIWVFPKLNGFSLDPLKNEIYQKKRYLDDLDDLETSIKTLLGILEREKKKYDSGKQI